LISGHAAETMNVTRTDSYEPCLGIGYARPQTVTSGEFIVVKLIFPRFNVDSQKLPFITRLELRFDVTFVYLVAAAREFFFRIAALG
jgi:hypothetical protein